MFDYVLGEIERVLTPLALAAATAFIAYLFAAVKSWLGMTESDSNEMEVRRAAATEAGKLVANGSTDTVSISEAVSKIMADLPDAVKAEGYHASDIADMIVGNIPVIGSVVSSLIKGTK